MDFTKFHSRYLAVLIGAIVITMGNSIYVNGFGYFLIPVSGELAFSRSTYSVILTASRLIAAFAAPFWAGMISRFGARKVIFGAGMLTAFGFVLLANANSVETYFAATMVRGFGNAACTLFAAVIIVNTWVIKHKSIIMSLVVAMTGVGGVVINMVVPGYIVDNGWRNGFLFLAVVFAAIQVTAFLLIRSRPEDVGMKPYGYRAAAGGEDVETVGMSYKSAFKTPLPYLLFGGIFLLTTPAGMMSHMPAFYEGTGLSAVEAGYMMSVVMFAIIWCKIIMGLMNEKIGLAKTNVAYAAVSIAAFLFLVSMQSYTGAVIGALGYAVSITFATVMPPLLTGGVFGDRDYIKIYAVISIAAVLGDAVNISFMGMTYDATQSYTAGILLTAAMCAAGLVVILATLRMAKKLNR
ncbi:MAG TPA: hypothetical protein DEB31_08865 [Clostridiales bacterium]|nr:hypothetical protein [Clostridiales bacterium]